MRSYRDEPAERCVGRGQIATIKVDNQRMASDAEGAWPTIGVRHIFQEPFALRRPGCGRDVQRSGQALVAIDAIVVEALAGPSPRRTSSTTVP
jgi:hypothetical protein